jgi:hypothetical protein
MTNKKVKQKPKEIIEKNIIIYQNSLNSDLVKEHSSNPKL